MKSQKSEITQPVQAIRKFTKPPSSSVLAPRVDALFAEDVSGNSLKAYRSDLQVFCDWCSHYQENPLPCSSAALVRFLTDHAEGFSMATVERRVASISWAHRKAGFLGPDNPRSAPVVLECLRLLRRRYRDNKPKPARELSTELIRGLMDECRADKNTTLGLRDRAMILLGFAGAFRRSELVRVEIQHLTWKKQGLEITIPWSKTDQAGQGTVKYISRGQVPLTDPVSTLKSWLEISKIKEGPVFRRVFKNGTIGKEALRPLAVLTTVKNRMRALGRDDWNDFSAHSLRSGFASTAAENGASIQAIKGQGDWKSDQTAMRYIRRRDGWDTTAASKLGL